MRQRDNDNMLGSFVVSLNLFGDFLYNASSAILRCRFFVLPAAVCWMYCSTSAFIVSVNSVSVKVMCLFVLETAPGMSCEQGHMVIVEPLVADAQSNEGVMEIPVSFNH